LCQITFFKTQRALSDYLNQTIDDYWNGKTEEKEFIQTLLMIVENNREKLYKGGCYTRIIQQRCGVRRTDLITKITSKYADK